jgi:hypothetical protein
LIIGVAIRQEESCPQIEKSANYTVLSDPAYSGSRPIKNILPQLLVPSVDQRSALAADQTSIAET